MQTVRLGFSRKSHPYAGMTARRISSVRNTIRAGRINFWRRDSGRGIYGGPAYNLIFGISVVPGYNEKKIC
jgi:hypothetical protein